MSTLLAIVVAACRSNTQSALSRPADPSATPGSDPVDISKDWDSFYKAWVQPVVNFGTPTLIEGYSGSRLVMRSLFLVAECCNNKDDLFMKGFSYHTSS